MRKLLLRATMVLPFAIVLSADIIAEEPPDAGGQLATAIIITGAPGENISQIRGRINAATDLWGFYIADPSLFSARAVNCAVCDMVDPQLFLLDANGFGIYLNDDRNNSNPLPLLPAGHPNGPQVPGFYYLGISSFDRDPRSVNGRIFPNNPATAVHGPTGPGGADPLSGYAGGPGLSGGIYRINLTGASAVPEPAAWMTMGGALALGLFLRRRRPSVN